MKLLVIAGLLASVAGCEPTNTYVVEPGFAGPVVVVWGDPRGAILNADREIEVGIDGRVFLSGAAPPSFRARFRKGSRARETVNVLEFQNALQYGDCGGKRGPTFSEDSFFVGSRQEGRMKELRKEMLVETMRRRGLNELASCWSEMPLSYFESL